MPPMGVVEALDVLEECGFRLLERIEVGAVDQFRLQGAEEALDHSVVGRGSRRSHAGPQAVGGEDASNQIGCVLTTSIAVMDRALTTSSAGQSLAPRVVASSRDLEH